MKNLTDILIESKVEGYTIELRVATDKDAQSYSTYNLNGINNAVKEALQRKRSIFFAIEKDGKECVSDSFIEAIEGVK